MRNKIRQMMKKEDGFTLVELLAVIVILGIIIAIAIPAVGSVIDNARTNAASSEESLIIDAARLYEADGNEISTSGIHTDDLVSGGYLQSRDSKTGGTVTKTGNEYAFTPD